MAQNTVINGKPEVFIISDSPQSKNTQNSGDEPADFEKAITATKFGKFNIILLLIATPSGWSSIFETTSMSYVFPAAQCDLALTLEDKGLLNAITYAGMMSSAFIWGFLCDTLGRRKLLFIGFFLDAFFVWMSATSQSAVLLMVAKFMGGFIINGPFAALTAYVSEFHCAKHRGRIQMVLGLAFSSGAIMLPILGSAVLPSDLNFKLFNDSLEFHSWNVYLMICSLPALTSAIAFLFMPESPKFLMTMGKNKEALQILRKVYSVNTGNSPESFPIKSLVDETKANSDNPNRHGGVITANRSSLKALTEGWQQIKPLFFPPHLFKIMLVCSMQMMIMMSLNTLRLWLPQIFQAINDYQDLNNGTTASLCTKIELIRPGKSSGNSTDCVVNFNNFSVYINSIIVAGVTIVGYIVAGFLINSLGKKRLISVLGMVAGFSAMSMYFAQNNPTTITLSSIFIALSSICLNVTLAVVVDLFPTTLRTMTVSLTMMLGRAGPLIGNLVFPLLLLTGCAAPFLYVGSAIMVCVALCCFLPNTDMQALV